MRRRLTVLEPSTAFARRDEEDDHFHDQCGVFAIYGHPEAANLAYLGLHALQHRGQESAGIVTRDGQSWLVPDHQPCEKCDVCKNPAFLAGVFHAPDVNAVLVEIGYKGTDTCWQPSDSFHVVAW